MQVSIFSNFVMFYDIDAYNPPDWIDEAFEYALRELGGVSYYIEGNNDRRFIRTVFSQQFNVSDEKAEEAAECLEDSYS